MGPEDIVTIGATVTLLTQIVKRAMPKDGNGPLIVALLSLIATVMWIVSAPVFPPDRTHIWTLFTGWASIWATASGIYSGASIVTTGAARVKEAAGRG